MKDIRKVDKAFDLVSTITEGLEVLEKQRNDAVFTLKGVLRQVRFIRDMAQSGHRKVASQLDLLADRILKELKELGEDDPDEVELDLDEQDVANLLRLIFEGEELR